MILCESDTLRAHDVEACLQLKKVMSEEEGRIKKLEQREIIKALAEVGGDRKQAARLLGISVRTLYYRLKKINEPRP
jgi:transcriptional regulator of acetoin/glycerol metabolism